MNESNTPADSRSDEQLFRALLAAIGETDDSPFVTFSLRERLEEIETGWLERPGQLTPELRDELRKFRKNTARRQKRRETINALAGRDLADDIIIADWLLAAPDADERELRAMLAEARSTDQNPPPYPAQIEQREDRGIEGMLGKKYRPRDVTTYVVEPFLRFLQESNLVPSRKLPRSRMMKALFDWLKIEPTLRPKGINSIVRNLKPLRSIRGHGEPDEPDPAD